MLKHDLGQLMGVGFDDTHMTPALRTLITDLHLGGLVLFARNVDSPAQLTRLIADCQQVARDAGLPPLFISVDQEGGRVARLRAKEGFTEFPSPKDVAARGVSIPSSQEEVRRVARVMAGELRQVGVNIELAPVLDVNNNPANPVIGDRSFGADPHLVAACGVAFIETVQGAGLMCVGKHFPGHGDVTIDSHFDMPVVGHARERLETVEFVPFKAAMDAGIGGIMLAHVNFPALEPSGLPATLSPNVMRGLLRDELGFKGLLFTDALEMGALTNNGFPVHIAAARSLEAGVDVLMFNSGEARHRKAHAELVAWAERGDIPRAQIDASLRRVADARTRFGIA